MDEGSGSMNIKNRHSQGVNDLRIKPVKHMIDIVAPIIQHVFDLALKSRQFPIRMQIAKAIAMYTFKEGKRITYQINDLYVYFLCFPKV